MAEAKTDNVMGENGELMLEQLKTMDVLKTSLTNMRWQFDK